jgi:hypothetical protein
VPLDWGNVAGGAIGGSLALLGNVFLQRLAHRTERRRRAEERSEAAAREILDALSDVSARFASWRLVQDDLPSYSDTSVAIARIDGASVDILDERIRRELDQMTISLGHLRTLAERGAGDPPQVTWLLRREARAMLGRMRRDEPFQAPDPMIQEYIDTVEKEWAAYEELRKHERERHKREKEGG